MIITIMYQPQLDTCSLLGAHTVEILFKVADCDLKHVILIWCRPINNV